MKANQKFIKSEDAQIGVGMIGGLVALLITIIVGILIYWQLSGSIALTNDAANESRDGVNSMASTVFSLLPIIALVVVASIILGVVVGFGRGGM